MEAKHQAAGKTERNTRTLRILVVEDNFLIAETIREAFVECGHEVVGPVGTVKRALRLLEEYALDGAILDINLNGEFSFVIAEELKRRGVSFLFLTGYDDLSVIPVNLRKARRFAKPFDPDALARNAAAFFAGSSEEEACWPRTGRGLTPPPD